MTRRTENQPSGVHFDGLLLSADKQADSPGEGLRLAGAAGTIAAASPASPAATVRHRRRRRDR
ncbi:MAG TPA: hypothetical protein VFO77_07135 [Actinoplanes sp.]|nr:hypothetical protein [Actinoplanes sp.]